MGDGGRAYADGVDRAGNFAVIMHDRHMVLPSQSLGMFQVMVANGHDISFIFQGMKGL